MASKDKALFEVRKYNDFSVLCSDDENEEVKEVKEISGTEAHVSAVAPVAEAAAETGDDGFETFTTVRKVKRVSQSKASGAATSVAAGTRLPGKPKEVVVPKAENSIELYEFPSTLKTNDLRKFLQEFDGHYRLKWINDTSCYVVFDDESLGKQN